ncbi:hypothetical protein GCM10008927_27500 [Amylibacter ulvae]|uniref:RNase NYN domain-containing protein n=1 Tax=Paramylibacter ulvae TaxID=1651968 RepID=A0ABQ3DC59_9RHOB|nr:hypothetical protein [Amylibacter ulvae]GHA60481.1 hypothetical protein GCM10008927_27500 [Amylibacter ulvae]
MIKSFFGAIFRWLAFAFCAGVSFGALVFAISKVYAALQADSAVSMMIEAGVGFGIAGFMGRNAAQLFTNQFFHKTVETASKSSIIIPPPAPIAVDPPETSPSSASKTATAHKKAKSSKFKSIAIDGSNVFLRRDPNLLVMHMMVVTLLEMGHEVHVFFDANIYYVMEESGIVFSGNGNHHNQIAEAFGIPTTDITIVPGGSQADHFILPFADKPNGVVITNDRFSEFAQDFPWVKHKKRLAKFDVVQNHLLIPRFNMKVELV